MSDQQNTSRTALIILIKAKKPKRKKAAKWLYPWATEHHYTQLYRTWLKPVKEFVSEFMSSHQEAILNGDSANSVIRSDAVAGESFHLMVQSLNNWVGAYISDDEQKKLRSPIFLGLGDVAQSAFNFNGNQYDKSVHSALGIDFPSDEAWWTSARKMWQDTNYDIIKSDIKKYIADINSATEQAVTNGWSVKALQEQIKALDTKITKSRAAFIARDQIGKLNGTITQKRMEDIGLTMYEWSGSVDERERDSHRVMEGKLCRWDDATVYSDDGGKTWKNRADIGGVLKHPGMDYQCRCCALAYFNELIDEAEGVNQETEIVVSEQNQIGNFVKGKPMSVKEADSGHVNPKFNPRKDDPYSNNCQSCVVAYEARLRGFKVQAGGYGGIDSITLSKHTNYAWLDKITDLPPEYIMVDLKANIRAEDFVKSTVKAGERYTMQYQYRARNFGHIVTLFRDENNKLVIYDPQANKKLVEGTWGFFEYFTRFDTDEHFKMLRIDNCNFNEVIVKHILEAAKK